MSKEWMAKINRKFFHTTSFLEEFFKLLLKQLLNFAKCLRFLRRSKKSFGALSNLCYLANPKSWWTVTLTSSLCVQSTLSAKSVTWNKSLSTTSSINMPSCSKTKITLHKSIRNVLLTKRLDKQKTLSTFIMKFISSRWNITFLSIRSKLKMLKLLLMSLSKTTTWSNIELRHQEDLSIAEAWWELKAFTPLAFLLHKERNHLLKHSVHRLHLKTITHPSTWAWEPSCKKVALISNSWVRSIKKRSKLSLTHQLRTLQEMGF